jgi:thioredoxin reductase/ferredoxin
MIFEAIPDAAGIYLALAVVILVPYGVRRLRRTRRSRVLLDASRSDGLMEPASLHPLINASRCLGCGTCVTACPESNVLGLVNAKAALVTPANCIGHGACAQVCPMDAITLVLGTETRGVDIPVVNADFETNVPGIFVAGELGGMGLIRNAIEQGKQALQSVAARVAEGDSRSEALDIVIIGAGPAGFAATLAATELNLRVETLEQETLGGTVAHYPRGKIVMTSPVSLPMFGEVMLRETSKEELLGFWRDVEKQTGIEIRYEQRVTALEPTAVGFAVTTESARFETRCVLLAIGRRGTPRCLGVPGEDSNKVVYRLIDPEQYASSRVLVAGGGDSAIEAATEIADISSGSVTLLHRGAAFDRAKSKNRARLEEAEADGRVRVLRESEVVRIEEDSVEVKTPSGSERLDNDAVIVCIGGILPTDFLRSAGIEIETKHGNA